jgi:GGDEF domain-containing protein
MTRILIAGSENIISAGAKIIIEAKGYQLLFFQTLSKAISQIFEDPPDILILEKHFAGDGEHDLIKTVKSSLQKTNIPILLVLAEEQISGLDWKVYPVDDLLILPFSPEVILTRIQLAEARLLRVFDNNPLSKLPGNTSILRAIQGTLTKTGSYGVCYVDIDNFKPYNDRYGFSQGDDIILMVSRVLVNVVDELAREDSFVGHVGGDDYVFIVREEKIEIVCEKILANFEMVRNMFLSTEDLAAGCYIEKDRQGRETTYGLLSLSIAVVISGDGNKFEHAAEIAAIASQVKHYVKKLEGSNYMIDRREKE